MKQLPIFLDVQETHCLVVGGGPVAARKTKHLLEAGAQPLIIAPTLCNSMMTLVASSTAMHKAREYQSSDLSNTRLVIAATDNAKINLQIAADAKQQGILANIADNPEAGSFTLPSIIDRDPLTIAISSGGTAPVVTRLLKAQLEAFIPKSYATLAALAGEFRTELKTKMQSAKARKLFWERTLSGSTAELALTGQVSKARQALKTAIESIHHSNKATGEVYLVGAGPGNPDLLTFRALRLMQQADVVLHDRLVSSSILDLCRNDAERIYVGKQRANHTMEQSSINQTLLDHAKAGKRVLRLKGGDPFIFGRGGEEIETLAEHNIPFQVVPGITAASGCASYAGIPLTHRDHAQSCTFVTGHLKDGSIDLDWNNLVSKDQTIVCYMGLGGLPVICKQLIAHGLPDDTPAALIERGTTREQKVHTGTVQNLPTIIAKTNVTTPALIIIGSVVSLHGKLNWFNQQPAHENHLPLAQSA